MTVQHTETWNTAKGLLNMFIKIIAYIKKQKNETIEIKTVQEPRKTITY